VRESHRCHLGSDKSQNQDRYGHEIEEEDNEEKGNEKANISNGETSYYFNVGRVRVLERLV